MRTKVKKSLKNALWAFYGAGIKNPPLLPHPKSLLFVCLGNICRSAYAHGYCSSIIESQPDKFNLCVASAGLRAKDARSPEFAISAARTCGIDLTRHIPQQIDEEHVLAADMVLVMEPKQMNMLCQRYPQYSNKFFLLPFFEKGQEGIYDNWHRYHIEDPYGRNEDDFLACFRRIERCVNGLLKHISTFD